MNTTDLIKPPPPPSAANERSATPNAHPARSVPPTGADMITEILPLIGVVPVAGPPVIFVAGPWVLLALMLTGPCLLLVTVALGVIVLVAATAAILAPPYLLVRHLATYWTGEPEGRTADGQLRQRPRMRVSLLSQRRGAGLSGTPADKDSATAHLHNHPPTPLTPEGI